MRNTDIVKDLSKEGRSLLNGHVSQQLKYYGHTEHSGWERAVMKGMIPEEKSG